MFGIESWLNAEPLLEIIERVGSSNLKVYYDVGNMHRVGADIFAEIEALGVKLAAAKEAITTRFVGQERVVDLTLGAP